MTRVDFYITPESGGDGLAATASRLCDKAVASGQRVYVNVADAGRAAELDSLLWTQRQGSFLAHEVFDGKPPQEPQPPVLTGSIEPPPTHHAVMINLASEVPPWFSRFERVLEIVAGDAAERAQSRERFKYYRDRGYELKTHNL